MKTLCLNSIIAMFLFFHSNGILAQTTQTNLNQVELMKQWIGSWRTEGTFLTTEIQSFGTDGLEGSQKIQVKDSIVSEVKMIFGYDKKSDKYIVASISNSRQGVILMALWFSSEHLCERIPFEYISNPEQATTRAILEFKSKDLMVGTYKEKNKPDRVYTSTRENK
jgi:hypothetical protein